MARLGIAVTRERRGVEVVLRSGSHVVLERNVDLAPDAPLVERELALPAGTQRTDLDLVVRHGRTVLIEYRPARHPVAKPPLPAREPARCSTTAAVTPRRRHCGRRPRGWIHHSPRCTATWA